MCRPFLVILAVGVAFAGTPRALQAQFSVDPVIVTLSSPASVAVTEVWVRNASPASARFTFYLGDFDQTETGENLYAPAGSNANSCHARASVFPNGATLAPGQRQAIQVRLQTGSATCWSMLFVETREDEPGKVSIGQRIGVKVYGVAPGMQANGEMTGVEAATTGDSVRVTFSFQNLGRRPLRPAGRVEIRNDEGATLMTVPVDAFSVLPGHSRRETIYFRRTLASGRYLAVPILDFGADHLTAGQAPFRIL